MDTAKKHAPRQSQEPVKDLLIGRKTIGQHAPLAPHHLTHRIDHCAQMRLARCSRLRLLWQRRRDQAPLFLSHTREIATCERRPLPLVKASILLPPHRHSLQNIKDV